MGHFDVAKRSPKTLGLAAAALTCACWWCGAGCGSRTGLDLLGRTPGNSGNSSGGSSGTNGAGTPVANCVSSPGLRVLATGLNSPTYLAVDSTFVYWGTATSVMRVSLCGGAPTTLASSPNAVNGIAVGASNVYWTAGGNVMTVPLTGGTATTVASGQGYAEGIALDLLGRLGSRLGVEGTNRRRRGAEPLLFLSGRHALGDRSRRHSRLLDRLRARHREERFHRRKRGGGAARVGAELPVWDRR